MLAPKYVVPEAMLDAAHFKGYGHRGGWDKQYSREFLRGILETAIEWLANNPIKPTTEQAEKMIAACKTFGLEACPASNVKFYVTKWQRLMFEEPAPAVPPAVQDLMVTANMVAHRGGQPLEEALAEMNRRTIEAYRRGQKDGLKHVGS